MTHVLAITTVANPGGSPPSIRVTVADTGTTPYTSVTVYRVDPSGNQALVRTTDGNALALSAGTGFVDDWEIPYGIPVTYTLGESPSTVSSAVTVASSRPWLVDPGVPSQSMTVRISEYKDPVRTATRGVFRPLGRANAVAITDGRRKSGDGEVTFYVSSDSERQALDDLLNTSRTLLFNVPVGNGWGIDQMWVSFGDLTPTRPGRVLPDPTRTVTLPFTVVDSPVGGAQAAWTWNDVVAHYATWNALIAAKATWNDVLNP